MHTQVTRVVVWHFEPDWFDFKIYLVKARVGQNIGNNFFFQNLDILKYVLKYLIDERELAS